MLLNCIVLFNILGLYAGHLFFCLLTHLLHLHLSLLVFRVKLIAQRNELLFCGHQPDLQVTLYAVTVSGNFTKPARLVLKILQGTGQPLCFLDIAADLRAIRCRLALNPDLKLLDLILAQGDGVL